MLTGLLVAEDIETLHFLSLSLRRLHHQDNSVPSPKDFWCTLRWHRFQEGYFKVDSLKNKSHPRNNFNNRRTSSKGQKPWVCTLWRNRRRTSRNWGGVGRPCCDGGRRAVCREEFSTWSEWHRVRRGRDLIAPKEEFHLDSLPPQNIHSQLMRNSNWFYFCQLNSNLTWWLIDCLFVKLMIDWLFVC